MTLSNVVQRNGWLVIAAASAIGLLLVAQGASRGSAQTACSTIASSFPPPKKCRR